MAILRQEINDAIVMQIQHEFRNMLIYKQLESYFEDLQLKNLAKRFKDQADEEYGHATKFIDYLNSRIGGKVTIQDVPSPDVQANTILDVANLYVTVEQQTTDNIEDLYELIVSCKSYMDIPFIQEMLAIQVTEEDEADAFIKRVAMVKDIVLFDATFEG
jgi:ferritin